MEEAPSKKELTPEYLYQQIVQVRSEFGNKITELQSQLETLGVRSDANDLKQNSQIVRVAMLIDTAMDNIQTIIGIINDVNEKIATQDQQIWSHGNSISINKRNLTELSKYIKKADKAWKEAQQAIAALNEAEDQNGFVRWKVGVFFSAVFAGIVWLLTGSRAYNFWQWICSLFTTAPS